MRNTRVPAVRVSVVNFEIDEIDIVSSQRPKNFKHGWALQHENAHPTYCEPFIACAEMIGEI